MFVPKTWRCIVGRPPPSIPVAGLQLTHDQTQVSCPNKGELYLDPAQYFTKALLHSANSLSERRHRNSIPISTNQSLRVTWATFQGKQDNKTANEASKWCQAQQIHKSKSTPNIDGNTNNWGLGNNSCLQDNEGTVLCGIAVIVYTLAEIYSCLLIYKAYLLTIGRRGEFRQAMYKVYSYTVLATHT